MLHIVILCVGAADMHLTMHEDERGQINISKPVKRRQCYTGEYFSRGFYHESICESLHIHPLRSLKKE